MSGRARQTGPAVEAHFRFLQWLVPTVEKFPRARKFLLGGRIQSTALDVLEACQSTPPATGTAASRAPISV